MPGSHLATWRESDHEVIAGFCVIEAPDRDAALQIAGRNPILGQGGGVEVRPVAGWALGRGQ